MELRPYQTMELRPYQTEAISKITDDWENGARRTLLVLPTGCGKTVVFCKVAEDRVKHGDRVLILAHRGELISQAQDKLTRVTGLRSAVEKADETCLGSWYRVAVGSVQSLGRESRLSKFPSDYFGTIIVDEAHHALSESYRRVLDHFGGSRVLGVTATPDRGDRRNLGEYFEKISYEYTLPKAIKEGYLSPIKALTIPLRVDMSSVGIQNGDYKAGDIAGALDPYLCGIADEMAATCRDRKTVVFLPLIATSKKFCDILNAKGFRAAYVTGESADRAEILEGFERGKYNVLCNSMLLTEGWDCPPVDCIVPLRPTKIRSLYCQMVGRGTRLCEGKENLLLLDFLWHTERHELCRPAHLICDSDEVRDKMTENLEKASEERCPIDLEEAVETASSDVVAEREKALAERLAEMKKRKRALVDPLQFEMSIMAEDLTGYIPSFPWEMAPPSDKQLAALEKFGIAPDEVANAGKASLLLDRLSKRRMEGLATPKQIRKLESYGFLHVGTWDFDSANRMISRIAANAWRLPVGITPKTYVPSLA